MAKGASGSQAATLVPRAGGGASTGGSAAARAPPTAAGLRKRTTRSSGSGAGRQSGAGGGLNFYTDDAPGLKMSPVVVVFISVGFIIFVTVLHIVGKLRGI
ncbi:hypothetical protein WJX75_009108 [Coccomyxa subellipsoidea]|uniref:Protein transport protein Sec61 subunit beta n=1 Tax=Coccomyxa subellipsoidea TaxID=248742 RepID=A0ABR2YIC6_9CHLO